MFSSVASDTQESKKLLFFGGVLMSTANKKQTKQNNATETETKETETKNTVETVETVTAETKKTAKTLAEKINAKTEYTEKQDAKKDASEKLASENAKLENIFYKENKILTAEIFKTVSTKTTKKTDAEKTVTDTKTTEKKVCKIVPYVCIGYDENGQAETKERKNIFSFCKWYSVTHNGEQPMQQLKVLRQFIIDTFNGQTAANKIVSLSTLKNTIQDLYTELRDAGFIPNGLLCRLNRAKLEYIEAVIKTATLSRLNVVTYNNEKIKTALDGVFLQDILQVEKVYLKDTTPKEK